MKLLNQTNNTVLAERLRIANSFFSRLKGLLGTSSLPVGEALLIRPCNSIHMFGMRYSIDVIFADDNGQVLKTVASLEPGRLAKCHDAKQVIELPCGALYASNTKLGDILEIVQEK